MDGDLLLIFGFVLTICLIVFPFAMSIHKRTVAHDERKLELKARVAEARAQEARFTNGDYSKMEERVRVLERIATDSNHALASQIEHLRDLNEIEDQTESRETAQ